jgi:hypothetical protein
MPTDTPLAPTPVARRSFACASCGNEAGLVALFERGDGGGITRHSFTSTLTLRVAAEDFERIRGIILAGDVRALHEFDLEVASFYCPDCGSCYCGDHWVRWNVFDDEEGFDWHDSIRGRCPQGHQRMLED